MTALRERSVRIFALGSPHGDDQVAWMIAERLSQDLTLQPLVHTLATPWDLVELLVPDCSVIVIDACVREATAGWAGRETTPTTVIDACFGGATAGTVLRINESELATSPIARQSTHGGSLFESLELARALQRTIREIVVFAVAVESCEPGSELSESARCAVDDTVRQVQVLLSEWLPNR
ncbi:MAG: hydrogenase maturation protease [Planctomycetia bacterium]|nr:hydrogenase maturation protease [Planctomycetia bacterium]